MTSTPGATWDNPFPTPVTNKTTYLAGFQYKDNQLEFFPHAEGYVKYQYSENSYSYVFNYTDHLGNIRVSYSDIDKNGLLGNEYIQECPKQIGPTPPPCQDLYVSAILEENHYYPFGLKHEGYNSNNAQPNYNYKYQGQELETELGKNTYAYQWRDYDPAIGRFNKMDRLTEKYPEDTPYHFSKNSPVYYREIAGDSINVSKLIFQNGTLNKEGLYVLFNTISDLQTITGTSISVNSNGNLVSKDGEKDANGNLGGSSKARTYLNSLISSTSTINVTNDNNNSTQGGGIGSVNINSNQIDGNIQSVKNAGIGELTFGYGMSFLHETLHTTIGTRAINPNATTQIGDPSSATPFTTGPTVDKINEFRSQLGLSTRSNYFWQATSATSPATMQWNVGGNNVNIIKTTMSATDQQARRKTANGFVDFFNNVRF